MNIGLELKGRDHSHTKAVVGLEYSPNRKLVASSGADKKVNLYDAASCQVSAVLEDGHTMGINSSVWINDSLLATASDDRTVKVWDVEQNKVLSTFKTSQSVVYSLAVNPINKILLCGCVNGSVVMHHLSSRDAVGSFVAQADAVVSIETHPDGAEILTGGQEGIVRVWDSANLGMCYQSIVANYNPHKSTPLSCVSYTPNMDYVLASSLNSTHRLIPLNNGTSHTTDGECLTHSGDLNQSTVLQYEGHRNEKYSIASRICCTARGDFLVSGSEDGKAYWWDLNSKAIVATTSADQGAVLAVAHKRDTQEGGTGDQFATAGVDGSVMFWQYSGDSSEHVGNIDAEL